MKRRLSLKSETLAELTTDDLLAVHGGNVLSDRYGRCTLDDSYLVCHTLRDCSLDCPTTFNTCGV